MTEEETAAQMSLDWPEGYFQIYLKGYPQFADQAAKKMAVSESCYYMSRLSLFPVELEKYRFEAARNCAKDEPEYFLSYFAEQYPDYVEIANKSLSNIGIK